MGTTCGVRIILTINADVLVENCQQHIKLRILQEADEKLQGRDRGEIV
jgi:hypothetical protein